MDGEITIARVMAVLAHIEWEVRLARLALQQLDPGTKIPATEEIKALSAAEPPSLPNVAC
ncbi:MAG: hypothetical protein HY825_08005 [Acidobacteria bacterium]|nr:hypothetical protein [Acidobacteriota bacterium]